jgi:hypothetical protein
MKKAPVLITLIILLLAPLVSAGELTYYPDEKAFQEFLSSGSTYMVVAGSDDWARGWAYYVDEKLYTVKRRGNDVTVLVGNVYNNEQMASLWDDTGLPRDASLLPSVIVLNDTVLITGSENNIYLTERAFAGMWHPSKVAEALFAAAILILTILFMIALSGDNSHAGRFYALAVSLYALWYLNAERPYLTEGFMRYMLSALRFTVGGSPDSPLSAMMGAVFKFVPPVEENIVFVHWLLIFLILSFSFYLAPRRSRELGFLVFGLAFSAPMFRLGLDEISGAALGIAGFVIALAIINNVTFSPEKWKALLQTLVLSLFTLLAIVINPYLAVIPLIFVMAFPKRHLRNYAYLLITGAGVFLIYEFFGIPVEIPKTMEPNAIVYLQRFLLDGGLAVAATVYAAANRKEGIRMKGQTAFLLLASLVYLPLALFIPSLFPYGFVLLSALAVRMIHGLTPGT